MPPNIQEFTARTNQMPDRTRARELAAQFTAKGDPLGWFDALYREAESGTTEIPWADLVANPNLLDFWKLHPEQTRSKSALVIGSGLGDDAEQLSAWGYQTTAFDISATAISTAKNRFPSTNVQYVAADLLAPPESWRAKFDFIFESYTLQSLPPDLRAQAFLKIAEFLKPAGLLLVIARGRYPEEDAGHVPWRLTRAEFAAFSRVGLQEMSFEDYIDSYDPGVRKFRATYRRP
ncbi:MAG: class I SAM-dependent methyltransferase [Candidatus Acidiferrales bacterium]